MIPKKNRSRKYGDKDEKVLYKLMNNYVYGKTMGNLTLTWVRERGVYPPLCWFFLDKSETVNAVTHHFSAFSNILKETFLINFASLTTPCVQILDKTQMEKFLISGFLVDLLLKKIVITPEPVMRLGPETNTKKYWQ